MNARASTRRTVGMLAVAVAALAAMAGAGPAGATVIQNPNGQPYTGPVVANSVGGLSFVTSLGTFTCDQGSGTGQLASGGAFGAPALGSVNTLALSGGDSCVAAAVNLPWQLQANWVSDSTTGEPNGTLAATGVTFQALDCVYGSNSNGTAFTTREGLIEFYNADNTPSGASEMRFESEPAVLIQGPGFCPPDGTVSGTFTLTSPNGVSLEIRGDPAPPIPNETVNARVIEGVVLIKRPGEEGFTPLDGPSQIPVGSEVDTTNGRVEIQSASDFGGGTRTGQFYDGVFEVKQESGKGKSARQGGGLVTVLDLVPGAGCGKRADVAGRRKGGNGLWGSEKGGGHKTKGNKGSGSTRGTIWFVGDTCNGKTIAKVKEGKIRFRDFEEKKTIVLKKGDRYVAG